jgi:hypothetical protein
MFFFEKIKEYTYTWLQYFNSNTNQELTLTINIKTVLLSRCQLLPFEIDTDIISLLTTIKNQYKLPNWRNTLIWNKSILEMNFETNEDLLAWKNILLI